MPSLPLPPHPAADFFSAAPGRPFDAIAYYRTLWQEVGDLARVPPSNHAPHEITLAVHPDHVARVMQPEDDGFRKDLGRTQGLAPLLGAGSLLCLEGEPWREERQLHQGAFGRPALESRIHELRYEAQALAQRWEHAADAGRAVDAEGDLEILTLRLAARLLLGVDLPEPRAAAFIETFEAFTEPPAPTSGGLPTPDLEAAHQARQLARSLLAEATETLPGEGARCPHGAAAGLMTDLLRPADDATRRLDRLVTLLFTGYETCAKALPKALAHLAETPEVARALEREADIEPPADAPRSAPLAQRVLLETLRLDPPVWSFSRWAHGDQRLGRHHIPDGTLLVLCPYFTHRHPDFWPRPEIFDPQRFKGDSGELLTAHRHHRFAYFPFGAGRHHCLGRHLAMLEAAEILPALAARLRWRLDVDALDPATAAPHRHTAGATLGPGHSVRLRLERREEHHP